jgi:cytochrome c oxidase subunit 2
MTTPLILAVLVLVAIAVWQLAKIFELSQLSTGKKSDATIANDDDNKYNGYLLFAFLVFIYGITIFSFSKYGKMVLPMPASEHGVDYDRLMWISFAIIFIVQTITQFLLHYFGYKYRGEKGKKALFYADNDKLELIWTIIPVITLAALIFMGSIHGLILWILMMKEIL